MKQRKHTKRLLALLLMLCMVFQTCTLALAAGTAQDAGLTQNESPDPSTLTSYTIDFDFNIQQDNQGFCFGMTDSGTFVMWQVSTYESRSKGGDQVLLRPHFKSNGNWTAYPDGPGNVEATDISSAVGYTASTIAGHVIHERIVVDGTNIKTYFGAEGTTSQTPVSKLKLALDYTHTDTVPLNKIGFRQSNGGASMEQEITSYDNILVQDSLGNVIYDLDFENGSVGFKSTNGSLSVSNGWLTVGSTSAVSEQIYTMIETGASYTDLPYATNSDSQLLDIHLPGGNGPFPVVVYFHGGAWLIGDKAETPESQGVLDTLVANGYAVVSVNYRLASEAKWPAQIYDCKAAVRYVRANAEKYGFDTDRIAVFGSSAGAHLALMTGLTNGMASMEDLSMGNADYSSDVMAVVSDYGISDLTKWDARESLFASMGDPIKALLGDDYTQEQALAASPITYVTSDSVPVLLCHGQNDTLVEPEHSSTLAEALQAANGVSKVDTYFPASGAHGDGTFWNSTEPTTAITDFLGKWFNPHVTLTNGDNSQSFSNVDLKTYPNATTMLKYADQSSSQVLHIVTPEVGEGPFPTIVFIHGGGFTGLNSSNGSIYWVGRGALEAVNAGYAVAFVDYRLGGEASYPAPVHDIKAAIRYLRANAETYHLDTDRFAIWGESAGGHLASFVALTSNDPAYEDLTMGNADYSSAIQAAVAWYPITDLTTNSNQQWTPNLMGYGVGTNYDACWDASPVAHVTANACPFYIQHGMADTLVEYQDSIDLYERLVAATGKDNNRLELFPGLIHGPGGMFLSERNLNCIYQWLNEKLNVPELTDDQKAARAVDTQILAIGDVSLDSKDAIEAARSAYDALSDTAKASVTKLSVLEAAEAAYAALMPTASSDGRVSIEDGCLVVPGGGAVNYYTTQTFSGDYTVEMRASVNYQALGLMLGNGTPNPALWCLALVDPYGIWIHQPGAWTVVNKVASDAVTKDVMVDVKVEITGTTAKTYLNGTLVDTCTLPEGSTSGPIGLRFSHTEAGKIDYIKVTQNGSVIFRDDFNFIDGSKWDIPVPVAGNYDTNLALHKTVTANSDVNMPQYFAQSYLTDGVTACGSGNFGYSSKQFSSADISSDPAVIQVDLGADYDFNHVVIHPRNDVVSVDANATSPSFMQDFRIAVSSDGTNWKEVYSVQDNPNPNGKAQGHAFETVKARYVQITTTKLGPMPSDNSGHYLQIAEIEVYNRENLALGKTASANNDVNLPQYFSQSYLTDGITATAIPNYGYSSKGYVSGDLSSDPTIITVDLGAEKTVSQIGLYPRSDIATSAGNAAHFPVDFDIQVSTNGSDWTTVRTVTGGDFDAPSRQYLYNFEAISASQIRIVVKGLSGIGVGENAWYMQIAEIQVFNRDCVDQQAPADRDFLNLPYANNSDSQLLDIHLPSGDGPFPVVVYYHGGAWLIGDKANAPEAQGILDAIVNKGYAVVSVNYRLASEAQWPAQIYDCKAAIRYIRANADTYHLDADRIAVFGASAGAHLALMTGLTNGMSSMEDLSMGNAEYSSDVMAVVSNYGISDLTKWDARESLVASMGDPIKALLGDDYTQEQALAASPITYVSKDSVPVYLAHGQNDTLVEPYHSSDLQTALEAVIDSELVDTYYPANGPHADTSVWNSTESITNILAFLQKRFEPNKPLTNGDNFRAFSSLNLAEYPNSTLNLQYASDSASQKLHIITPSTGDGPFPTIVFIHGGGFAGGNSSGGTALYTARGPIQALEDGYAVAFVDYRLGGEAKFPAPVYDIKAAIRYLRANAETYHLDENRFAIWGESAGGHLADFVAVTSGDPNYEDLSMGNAEYSSAVQACVSWYAITDLTTTRNQQYAPTLMGYGASSNYNGCLDASPIAHVTKDVCPFYIQHGLADDEVDYQDSIKLYELIVEAGGEDRAKLELFPGINHAVTKFLSDENVDKIVAWLNANLSNANAEAAQAVDALIDNIGEVTLDSKDAIETARSAYDALTDTQKKLVTKLDALEAAEAAYAILTAPELTDVTVSLTGPSDVAINAEKAVYTITAKDMVRLATVAMGIQVDADYLSEVKVVPAEGWYVLFQSYENGLLTANVCNNAGVTGSGAIASISATPTGKIGDTSVTIQKMKLTAYDKYQSEATVTCILENASIATTIAYDLYDVNRDSTVNLLDITRAQRSYGLTAEDTGWNALADVNSDGTVDITDFILILNHFTA